MRVIIAGGGFSGTLVAIHLLRQDATIQVDLVDTRLPGRGLAYSTLYHEHLLNVPAVRMSGFGSEPMHFLEWLRTHGNPAADAGLFAPRRLYGTYVQDLLETTATSPGKQGRLRHHFTRAQRVSFDGLAVNVSLENGERLHGDKLVLALGNPPSYDVVAPVQDYHSSPWCADALAHLNPQSTVLLIGSGLTAVDAMLALLSQGHHGTIHMISRRGKLPQAHTPYRPLPDPFRLPEKLTARNLLRAVRERVEAAERDGVNWRAVIDSLRPVTNEAWQQLTPREQARFLRHLKTWWDIHRHRMAPEIGARVQSALQSEQLQVHAGRVRKLARDGAALRAELQMRSGKEETLSVQRVINCTGPFSDYRLSKDPLVRGLLSSGYCRPGLLGVGLQTTDQGELIAANGSELNWLITLGPPRFGDLLETTAVPEVRKQAEAAANHLLSIHREPVEVVPEIFLAAGI